MIHYRRFLSVLTLLALLPGTISTRALAHTSRTTSGTHCPSGALRDAALGVALAVPSGWQLLPPGRYLPNTLVFGTRSTSKSTYRLRLVIEPFALGSGANSGRAAAWMATKIIGAEGVRGATRFAVSYAGTRAVLVRGLSGGLRPSVTIVLARQGDAANPGNAYREEGIYRIIAPGRSLAPDQRQALASLRFIHRTGYFLPPVGGGGR